MAIKWKFWEPEIPPKAEPKGINIDTFLFALDLNPLKIVSVERLNGVTQVIFRDKNNEVELGYNRAVKYTITDKQHQNFVAALKEVIPSVVTDP